MAEININIHRLISLTHEVGGQRSAISVSRQPAAATPERLSQKGSAAPSRFALQLRRTRLGAAPALCKLTRSNARCGARTHRATFFPIIFCIAG